MPKTNTLDSEEDKMTKGEKFFAELKDLFERKLNLLQKKGKKMSKWKCVTCSENCKLELESKPVYCMVDGGKAEWKKVKEETVTNRNQLPKLTVEVFDRLDCPEWAKWAAADESGEVWVFASKPHINISGEIRAMNEWAKCKSLRFKVDTSDWQNSLIERSAKLPEWCKVDAVGWHRRCGYFKVIKIDDVSQRVDIQQGEDKSKGYLSFQTVCNESIQARLRPYNADEMKALVGKVITLSDGSVALCTAYAAQHNIVIMDNTSWKPDSLILVGYTTDGKPCGSLEHLNENGEWVK